MRTEKPASMLFVGGHRCNDHAFADPFLGQKILEVDYKRCEPIAVATFSRMRPDYPFEKAAEAKNKTLEVHNHLNTLRNQIAENRQKAGCPPIFWMKEGWEDSQETRDLLKRLKLLEKPVAAEPVAVPEPQNKRDQPSIADTLRYKVYAGAQHLDKIFRTYHMGWTSRIDLGKLDQNNAERSVLGQLFCHPLLAPIPFHDLERLGFAYHDRHDRMQRVGKEMTAMWHAEIIGRRNLQEYPRWRYNCYPYGGKYRLSFGVANKPGGENEEIHWVDLGDLDHPCYTLDFLSHPWDFISITVKNTLFQNIMRRT